MDISTGKKRGVWWAISSQAGRRGFCNMEKEKGERKSPEIHCISLNAESLKEWGIKKGCQI